MIDAECLDGAVKIDRVAAQTLFVAGIQRNAQIKLFFRHNLGMNFLKIIHIRKLKQPDGRETVLPLSADNSPADS